MKKNNIFLLFCVAVSIATTESSAWRSRKQQPKQLEAAPYELTHKKDNTIIGSTLGIGGIGAIAAGAAGGAQWVPLGFGAGLLGGFIIGKGIQHHKHKRENQRITKRTVRSHSNNKKKSFHKKEDKKNRIKKRVRSKSSNINKKGEML